MRFTQDQRDYLAQNTTSLNYFIKIVRRDGLAHGITDHPVNVNYDGINYKSGTGYEMSSQQSNDSLGVDTLDLFSAFSEISGEISRGDIINGLYDGANCYLFMLAMDRLDIGDFKLSRYFLGKVTIEDNAFKVEMQSLVSALQQDVSNVIAVSCTHSLGDAFGLDGVAGCKYDLPANTVSGAVDGVESSLKISDSARQEIEDWFAAGLLTFTAGDNTGFSRDVKSYTPGNIELFEPLPYAPAVGDTYTLTPGCRRRLIDDCRDKFGQVPDYGGIGVFAPNSNVGNKFGGQG